MGLKEQICAAFCENVQISAFSGGLAISTPYQNFISGDPIGIYALGPKAGVYRIVDNALTIALLEAEGATMDAATRRDALAQILEEHGAAYDEEMGEIFKDGVSEAHLSKAILEFSALLLRLNDLILLTIERVKNTFEDDVRTAIRDEMDKRHIRYVEGQPVSDDLSGFTPDMVFYPDKRDPVALFIATNDAKLWQAMLLRIVADSEKHLPLSVIAVLETDTSVTQKVRLQADNRLDAVPRYRSGPSDTIQRIARVVVGNEAATVH
ncbi:DUF1828 domain-containing protein [Chelativorans sp. ZYF759]|uniref:DUF1828 domain-containing protein n=1 Tax=Chelativorans sp. ZYF759 TaxID=2692213 RepID=UPI00145D6FF1|nr:DUF1828 domain-containing protein [Chelativorans sp. ZYF759]NMG38981.1 DUF1828 domain-containing protein [Chelativorans sp. ZYF759]